MRFADRGRTVENDLARRLRTAHRLQGLAGSRDVEQRRLRRRAPGGRWSRTLTALHLSLGARRMA